MTARPLLTVVMAGFLTWNSTAARPAVLGMVVEADRAHLNSLVVTAGATIYDGDRFSTEAGGLLFLRGDGAMLELAEESEVMLRSRPNGGRGIEAELATGTLNFRVAGPMRSKSLCKGRVSVRPRKRQPLGRCAPTALKICESRRLTGRCSFRIAEKRRGLAKESLIGWSSIPRRMMLKKRDLTKPPDKGRAFSFLRSSEDLWEPGSVFMRAAGTNMWKALRGRNE